MRYLAFAVSLIGAANLFVAPAATAADKEQVQATGFAEIDDHFAAFRSSSPVPALAYGVVIDGKLVHLKIDGVRNAATGAKADAHTRFRIASMSKAFTALAILMLRDEGKLRLDDLAETHVPQMRTWRMPTSDSPRIRIRDLLSHTGGFTTDDPWGDRQQSLTSEQFSSILAQNPLFSRPPQTAMEYSNLGYALLGRIVTNVSGTPYDRFIEQRIMRPLGMNHSGYAFEGVPEAERANGYERDGEQWKLQPIAVHGEFGAMGGVYVTPEDYAKWLAFLLSAWPARDGPESGPARRSSVRELAQGLNFVGGHKRVGGPENDQCIWATAYGMGMTAARDCDLGLLLSHGGGYPGYGSFVALAPERGAAVFAFANRTYAGPAEPVWKSLFALDRAGMIPARPFKASARLEQMQATARAAYAAGNFQPLAGMIGSNLPLDRSLEDRTAELVRLKAQLGDCPTAEPMFASGESSTVFRWNCARGKLDGRMSLAPLGPPQLQVLDFFPQPDK